MPWTVKDVDKHKKGLSPKQKRQWCDIANPALKKCMDDGGDEATCAASAIRQANGVVGHEGSGYAAYRLIQDNNYPVRKEVYQGRQCIVVPVIMMREGVHHGSRGPLLHTAEELGKIPNSWDDIPIVVWHPENNEGQFVSACDPEVLEQELVGRVYHTQMQVDRLKAEAYLDEARLKEVSPLAYKYIEEAKPLDVSVGVFTDDEIVTGLWNGEEYGGIAKNHRPDHLALLPGGTGACSWADGCGIRANQSAGGEGGENMTLTLESALKFIKEKGGRVYSIAVNGETSLTERIGCLRTKLDSLDTLQKSHYLQEVFNDYIIYEVSVRGGGDISLPSGGNLFKQNYSISDNGEVTFAGDPSPVKKEVKYVVQSNQLTTVKGGAAMADKVKCCPEKVKLLTQSDGSPFKAADVQWLELLEEPQVDTLVALMQAKKVDSPKPITKEEAVQALQDQFADPEKFMKMLPAPVAEQIRHGMALHKAEKDKLITLITANSKNYTAEKLSGKSIEELQDLASLIKQPEITDYSVLGGGNGSAPNAEDILPPPGVQVAA